MSEVTRATVPGPKDRTQLMQMIGGYRVTQMIRAAARYGVCDALAGGPRTAAEVAAEVGADPALLHRLLRALAGQGILAQGEDGRFSNEAMGELLRKDVTGSLRTMALVLVDPVWWEAWGRFPDSLADGSVALERAIGMSDWERLARDPEAAARFNRFMVAMTEAYLPLLLQAYDFSGASHVIDVGGGSGTLLAGILAANPTLRGTVFDLPAGLEGAAVLLAEKGVVNRCEVVAGSFFEAVPTGGDVYLLRQILHDWNDRRALEIARTVRRAMEPGARLLVMDHLVPELVTQSDLHRWLLATDLHMHVLYGARERTESEMRELLAAGGFGVEAVVRTTFQAVTVAVPV